MNIRTVWIWTVILTLLNTQSLIFALDPNKQITQYLHDVWQTEDGLPQNHIHAIIQTDDGYLWIGSEEGLVRFDGVKFTVFNKQNTTAMKKSQFVLELFEDKENALWIGFLNGGLMQLKDGKFTAFSTKDGLSSDDVRAICADKSGNLWIGTHHGVNCLKNGKFTVYTTNNGLSDNFVRTIIADTGKNLWIGTNGGGLNRLKDGKFTSYTTQNGLSHNSVFVIYEDKAGSIWIGTGGGGLNRLKDGQFTIYTTKDGLADNFVTSIYEDKKGNFWLGTYGGLNRFKDNKFTTFSSKEGLSSNSVKRLFEDREGSLWLGTSQGGLNRLKDGKVVTYTTNEGLSTNAVRPIVQDRDGNIWIGTFGKGLNRLTNGKFTRYTTKDGLADNTISSLYEDQQGNLWIGTYGGLNRLRTGELSTFSTKDGLSSNYVFSLHGDSSGNLWIGTYGGGLNCMKEGKFTIYNTQNGLASNNVVFIEEDRDGILWLGTDGGLTRMKDGKFTTFNTNHGLSHNFVRTIHEDSEAYLWLGTLGGLNRFKDGKFTAYTTKQGLYDDYAFHILEDEKGYLWMTCNKGIFKVNKKELNDFADGKISAIHSISYDSADGMRSSECNGGAQPSGCKSRDGKLWFPTVKGVVVIDPGNIKINEEIPPVIIEAVVVDDQPIHLEDHVRLPPGKKKFEFHYTGLSFLVPGEVKFKYILEGFDEKWVEAGTRRTAYYTNIPPGDHRFRVIACNNDGLWNTAGASFEFYLQPYFYQTWWFYLVCIVVFSMGGVGFYQLRVRQLKKRKEELERLVAERTTDLERKTDQLEQEVTERKRAEEEAKEANRAKSEFLANMSHELRTPLNAVIGFSELLSSMAVDQKQKSYTRSIRTAGKSLLTLINDILDLSKIESGMIEIRYAPINPIMIFNEIEEIFHEKLARKNLTYITDIDEALPETLFLDETRLRQILLNLMGNAVKFTSDGHIKLSAKKGDQTEQPDPSARTPGQINLVISVEDTGIGIPPQEQELIFQPFKQQSGQSIRKYGGTGLGLSICKRLTEMMKGRISVESQPGKGSCFKLVLENVKVPAAEPVTSRDESFNLDTICFEAARVLVVDDVESNRTMLEEMLPRVNLEVLIAENGHKALLIAGEYVPDVIIMDIAMPVMDGFETTKALKSNPKTKDIPVLVLSASSSGEQKEKILESGFFAAYLEKPVNIDKLFKELSNYIPYSRTPESASPGADDRNRFKELPQETLRRLPGLIKILQEEMLPLTEHFKGALRTEEVKKFADKIKQLGEDFAIPGLIDYANQLKIYEQNFDIEGIEKSLADFPTLVKNLVLLIEGYDESRQ